MINGLGNYEFRAPFKSWLLRIAVNLCRDHIRRKKVRKIVQPFMEHENQSKESQFWDDSQNPGNDLLKKERAHHIHNAINKLPQDLKEVLILRDMQEFSYEEIAESLKWQIGTVKSRLFRARNELYQTLSPLWEDLK